jgi:hypothetical protein
MNTHIERRHPDFKEDNPDKLASYNKEIVAPKLSEAKPLGKTVIKASKISTISKAGIAVKPPMSSAKKQMIKEKSPASSMNIHMQMLSQITESLSAMNSRPGSSRVNMHDDFSMLDNLESELDFNEFKKKDEVGKKKGDTKLSQKFNKN